MTHHKNAVIYYFVLGHDVAKVLLLINQQLIININKYDIGIEWIKWHIPVQSPRRLFSLVRSQCISGIALVGSHDFTAGITLVGSTKTFPVLYSFIINNYYSI